MKFPTVRNGGIRARHQEAPETPGAGAVKAGPNSILDPTAGEPPIGQGDAELAAEIRDLAMEPYGPIKREIKKAQDELTKEMTAALGSLGPGSTAADYRALNEMTLLRRELSSMAKEVPDIGFNAGKAPAGRDFKDLNPGEQELVRNYMNDDKWDPIRTEPMEVSFQDFVDDPVSQICADPRVREVTKALYSNFPTRSAELNVCLEKHTYLRVRGWENDDIERAGKAGEEIWAKISNLVEQGAAQGSE